MRAEGNDVSIAALCRWFGLPRSKFYYQTQTTGRGPAQLDAAVVTMIREIIDDNPTFGVRRITAMLRRRVTQRINRKKVHRIIQHNGWQVYRTPQGKRPRIEAWPSRTTAPNSRWAIDTTHIFTAEDGWCHLTAIIDFHERAVSIKPPFVWCRTRRTTPDFHSHSRRIHHGIGACWGPTSSALQTAARPSTETADSARPIDISRSRRDQAVGVSSGHRSCGRSRAVADSLIALARDPQSMQQHAQFSRHGNNGSFLGGAATLRHDP